MLKAYIRLMEGALYIVFSHCNESRTLEELKIPFNWLQIYTLICIYMA